MEMGYVILERVISESNSGTFFFWLFNLHGTYLAGDTTLGTPA